MSNQKFDFSYLDRMPEKPSKKSNVKTDKQLVKALADMKKNENESTLHKETNNNESDKDLENSQKRLRINLYLTSPVFGDWLKENGFKMTQAKIEKMNSEKLDKTLEQLEHACASRSITNFFSKMVMGGIMTLEKILEPFYAIPGLAMMLDRNPQFQEILEEVRLASSLAAPPAKIRLLVTILQSAVICHTMQGGTGFKASPVPEPPIKYNDSKPKPKPKGGKVVHTTKGIRVGSVDPHSELAKLER